MGGSRFHRWAQAALAVSVSLCLCMAAAAAYGASGESEGGVKVLPDSSVIIQIINFVLLIFILNNLLYKPIRKILLQRKEKFDQLKLTIDAFDQDCKQKDAAFADGIKEARSHGMAKRDELVQQAEDEEKKIVENITKQAQAELSRVQQKIVEETETVRTALHSRIDDYAKDISEKILGRAF